MRTHDHDQLKATTDAHLADGSTTLMPGTWRFDPRIYVDPDHAITEQATIFDRLPLLAAFSSELSEPNACVARSLAGTPVLMARQPGGAVRAFLNSCRHPGTELVGGDSVLSHDLVELPCVERHGLVWVMRTPSRPFDYNAHFGALDAEFETMELGRFVAGPAVDLTVEANWKLIMDGFLETYHLRFLHARTLTRILHSDLAPFRAFDCHSRHVVVRKSYDPAVHLDAEAFLTNVLIEYTLFPNTNLMWAIDHFEVYQVEPIDGRADRCRVRLTLLVDRRTTDRTDQWAKNLEIAQRVIVSEDFAAAESIQRALNGRAAPSEFVLGRNEAALQHYHQQLELLWSAAAGV